MRHHFAMDAVAAGSGSASGGSQSAESAEQISQRLEKHPNWKKLRSCVLSFFGSILSTISSLTLQRNSSGSSAGTVLIYLLDSLAEYIPFAAPLPRQSKEQSKKER
jgi:hypothetical protein